MYFVGLDLGQARDHSALAVVERVERRRAFQTNVLDSLLVRYVERMPLGMPYPRVVERVGEIVRSEELSGACALAVDATGVGAPVVDMLRAARLGCDLTAVTITGGERGACSGGAGRWSVPKRDLIGEMQVLLEQGQMKIAVMKDTRQLVRELTDMKMRESAGARVRMGAEGAGQHDDLAIALALACWRARGRKVVGEIGIRPLPGISG